MAFFEWLLEINMQAAIASLIASGLSGFIVYNINQKNIKKTDLSNLIQEIEDIAIDYWCSDGRKKENKERSLKIKKKLQTLSWRVNQNKPEIKAALKEYRQSITSGSFESPNRKPSPHEDPRICQIYDKARILRKKCKIKRHH
ncbi:MAG: hypothetical protein ACPG05_04225 [Bdellovibrionales bacterium]